MTATITSDAINLQKSKQQFIDVYGNKQSVFLDSNETRKETFTIKSKATQSSSKNNQLYIPINLSKVIAQTYSDYEVGGGVGIEFETESLQETYNEVSGFLDLETKIPKAVRKKSYIGYSILRVRNLEDDNIKKEDIKIDIIPTKNYFPNLDGLSIGDGFLDIKEHLIISEVSETINGQIEKYSYVDSYKKDGKIRTYKKSKYKSFGNGNKKTYNSTSGAFTLDQQEEILIEPTSINYLPLFILNNETEDEEDDNIYNDFFGQSDLKDIFELLQENNDRTSQTSVEFIKHLESSMSLPRSLMQSLQQKAKRANPKDVDEEEAYLLNNIDKIYSHSAQEQPAHYIVKDLQTDKAITWIKQIKKDIAIISGIPANYLGVDEDTQKTATQIIADKDKFHKKIATRQRTMRTELQRLSGYLVYLIDDIYELPSIIFTIPEPQDIERDMLVATGMRANGLVSRETAIKKVFGFDDKLIKEEIERIESEDVINAEITNSQLGELE